MKISMRDLYILVACARQCLRLLNQETGFTRETIQEVMERIINEMNGLKITVVDEEKNGGRR